MDNKTVGLTFHYQENLLIADTVVSSFKFELYLCCIVTHYSAI